MIRQEKRKTSSSLYQTCLTYFAKNLNLFCTNIDGNSLNFKDNSLKLNGTISDDLIEKLGELNNLNDLSLSLFKSKQTCLRNIKIKNARLKKSTLKLLKEHFIEELTLNHLTTLPSTKKSSSIGNIPVEDVNETITFNDLIESLNNETKLNIHLLDISFNSSLFTCINQEIKCFKNLSRLNVSYTNFNNHSLDLIANELENLEMLDISATRVCNLQSLLKIKNKLRYLIMYNLKASLSAEMISIIANLDNLVVLDLSTDTPTQLFADMYLNKLDINKFLVETQSSFLDLQRLDISAQTEVNEKILIQFLETHSKLKFLGLALTNTKKFEAFLPFYKEKFKSQLIVTSDLTAEHLITSLKYYRMRPTYIQKTLFSLFNHTANLEETNIDLVETIQIAVTACIYNLTKRQLSSKIPLVCLNKIINVVLKIMEYYPFTGQIQKNCLFILRNGKILKDCNFDRFLCVKLALNNILLHDDQFLTQSAVLFTSVLSYSIEPANLIALGEHKYILKLLSIINNETKRNEASTLLETTLNALWSLTDESEIACKNFIDLNGLETYSNLINKYESKADILTRALGLINNIAEIKTLRSALLEKSVFDFLAKLSTHKEMKVNYFIIGTLCHLFSDQDISLEATPFRKHLISQMEGVICSWDEFEDGLGYYRSFDPFIRLMECSDTPVAQLWAIWGITLVTKSYPQDKREEIKKKNIIEKIDSIRNSTDECTVLHKACLKSINMLREIL